MWTRLTRTVDLTSVGAGQSPSLDFALSFDTEPGYDNVIVEAHTIGQDDWTTLADAGGLTDSAGTGRMRLLDFSSRSTPSSSTTSPSATPAAVATGTHRNLEPADGQLRRLAAGSAST